jgi:nitrogen-specific signal transduction histidine kinase/CheY-like chemotaxis protein
MTNDITHLKQAESRLNNVKKMEAIGQLTGGVAHDFNNLLAVIMGCAEFLELEPGHDDEMVQAILHATRRGAALTHRLLAYARQQPLAPKSIDLAALAVGMKALLRRTLGETIYIEDRMASDLWAANADPGQVEDALLNLAINARDAMPRGGTLTIACANEVLDEMYVRNDPEASPGEYVVLSVNDNGEGMDDDVKARAIEPFFTTKDVGEGSGLGLSMVFGFAKQSGGHVNIESEQGRGTTVKVYLPRAESLEHKSSRKGLVHIPKGAGETILLIEDDPIVRKSTAQTLAGLGYKLLESRDAAVARTILNEGLHFDLVLSDVVLPGGTSGPEFAKEILVQRPDAHIIFMSGYPPESAVQTGFIESGSVLLSKPLRRETLADALHAALNSRR